MKRGNYEVAIPGVRIGRILTAEDQPRVCKRCGMGLDGARSGQTRCSDCTYLAKTENQAERLGIDLSLLAEDEWYNKRGHIVKIREDVAA